MRLERARDWLAHRSKHEELYVVGGSVDGALELSRTVGAPAFGWHRLSLDRLALKVASPRLIALGRSPATGLALEALWSRVVHELGARGELGRFAAVANRPGLPRALARAMTEARLEGVPTEKLDPDLRRAAAAFEQALDAAKLVDRADLFELAKHEPNALPFILLDVPVHTRREWELVIALASRVGDVFATAPTGDTLTVGLLERALDVRAEALATPAAGALGRLQVHLFSKAAPPKGAARGEVTLLSAPGEVRECLEVARLVHEEARRGTPFDRMAVLLRAPGAYRSAIAEALGRAGIPAYFARGTRLPDPAGRALLSLLACAEDGLSASRFAEYLSLGEVPDVAAAAPDAWAPADPEDEALEDEAEEPEPDVDAPVVLGTLRAPRHWEQLLIDAAVIGGRDRWERRLDGLNADLLRQRGAPDQSEAQLLRLDRMLFDLSAFRTYALPLLDVLAPLQQLNATWKQWLDQLSALAERALRHPRRVRATLAELEAMADVGPVDLREVRRVLTERLLELNQGAEQPRFGKVYVGPVDAARGLSFDVVFAPGLAERIFPQKVREDPILPDAERERIDPGPAGERQRTEPGLAKQDERIDAERLQLQLAVGAAERRIALSYPRLDAHEGRPRVPSFYLLEALRAAEGELPTYEQLSRRAEDAVDARIGWPAPRDPEAAVDDAERDLSVLGAIFRDRSGAPRAGRARYLTQVNPHLTRALRLRWSRWDEKKWRTSDGLVFPSPEARAALDAHKLDRRPFSATALQHFAACPYRFFLSAVVRLSPREEPVAVEELDPLQRGSMVHAVQWGVLTALRERGELPVKAGRLDDALKVVDDVLDRVAREHHEVHHPAIDRIWKDTVEAIRADVRQWMRDVAASENTPWKFELSFGLGQRKEQDPDSRHDAVPLDGGLKLRGSIDLVEKTPSGALWATDYKTGKKRAEQKTVIGGGKTLQPVLYALALEQLFPGTTVEGGALWYCTQAGEFEKVPIPLGPRARDTARAAIRIVGEALEKGFLPAAPARDECSFCDYRAVCGTDEEHRVAKKPRGELEALYALRDLE